MKRTIAITLLMLTLLLFSACAVDDSKAEKIDVDHDGLKITLNENWENAWDSYKDQFISRLSSNNTGFTVMEHKDTGDLVIMTSQFKKDYMHFQEVFINGDLDANKVDGYNVYDKEESQIEGNDCHKYMLEATDGELAECVLIIDKDNMWYEIEIYSAGKDRLEELSSEIYDSITFEN